MTPRNAGGHGAPFSEKCYLAAAILAGVGIVGAVAEMSVPLSLIVLVFSAVLLGAGLVFQF